MFPHTSSDKLTQLECFEDIFLSPSVICRSLLFNFPLLCTLNVRLVREDALRWNEWALASQRLSPNPNSVPFDSHWLSVTPEEKQDETRDKRKRIKDKIQLFQSPSSRCVWICESVCEGWAEWIYSCMKCF